MPITAATVRGSSLGDHQELPNNNTRRNNGTAKPSTNGQWMPLVYPSLAVATTNPFFPLERHVLLATVRELLILDDSVNAHTLELCHNVTGTFLFRDVSSSSSTTASHNTVATTSATTTATSCNSCTVTAPQYLRHVIVNSKQWQMVLPPPAKTTTMTTTTTAGKKKRAAGTSFDDDKSSTKKTKRGRTSASKNLRNKQRDSSEGSPAVYDDETVIEKSNDFRSTCTPLPAFCQKVSNAEALADIIVQRSCVTSSANDAVLHKETTTRSATDEREYRRSSNTSVLPRKVSDADIIITDNNNRTTTTSTSITSYDDDVSAIKTLDMTYYGSHDISRFYNFRKRVVVVDELPPFLEVSIASEIALRKIAYENVQKLTESFDDGTLRMFLGYKSSTLKRDRLLEVLAEYLFDVSHAMFAWKQTERELLLLEQLDATERHITTECDERRILHTLFDHRALRKIGGFDNSSLLPHALSIARLCQDGVTWKDFAKTKKGKALLRHHRNGKSVLVGQKRRGQRVRTRQHHVVTSSSSSSENSEAVPRSRSSSITSHDDDPVHYQVETWSEKRQASLQMPDVLHISLAKPTNESWGVLLSKEGDMCVVVRVPVEDEGTDPPNHAIGLNVGDVILSVGDKRQDDHDNNGTEDWFRHVVNTFKSSNELNLVVRRVGSGQSMPTN